MTCVELLYYIYPKQNQCSNLFCEKVIQNEESYIFRLFFKMFSYETE